MGKPSRNFREGFFVFGLKFRIFWNSNLLPGKNHFLDFLQKLGLKESFLKPTFQKFTKTPKFSP
ncbi:MAG: hypothetical protein B7Z16_13955 [Algoriphagus sp. 32-45-6]|nr:MAG: hypothetical protein B7Z16_13955 [Algoriphagus sp. 32-45-6]